MANSKLLKEAIADAKAVKETALANAKLALEEAFTPRLQSILAAKLQAEAEENQDDEMQNEELKSSEVGKADTSGHNPGKVPALKADTDVEAGEVKQTSAGAAAINHDYTKTKDISEASEEEANDESVANEIAALEARLAELKGMEDEANHFGQEEESYEEGDAFGGDDSMGADDDMSADDDMGSDDMDGDDQDDMDLEAIIRELEQQLEGSDEESEDEPMYEEEEKEEEDSKNESYTDGSEAGTDKGEDPKVVTNEEESKEDDEEKNEVIDLEEILREMEKDMKGDDKEDEKKDESLQAELNEAYSTIKSLQKTINEVNLLNAKLLFANKLFRAHNMTNEQKVKVIETLDRTNSVREVKLVYATLAENFKYSTPTQKSVKKSITEGIASKVVKSTAPKAEAKQVIAESADFADRFKKLAGIIK